MNRRGVRRKNLLWLVLMVASLGLGITPMANTVAQTSPPLSAQQQAKLEEVEKLNEQVVQLYGEGKYGEAIPLVERVVAIIKEVLPPDHPHLASSYNSLGVLYQAQGRYEDAERYCNQALAIRKKVLDPNHPDLAISYNSLGILYKAQGRYEDAEEYYLLAVEIREEVLDPNHPHLATSYNNLASLYQAQGRYELAEDYYEKAVEIREEVLPLNHPDLATSYNDLGLLYKTQGRYELAENYYEKAIEIREEVLPLNHPDLATSYNNLASLYQAQGRYELAEDYYEKAVEIWEEVLPSNHPNLALSYNNLASLYQTQGRYEDAEDYFLRSLTIFEEVLPPNHPDLAQSYNNLAELHQAQGNYTQAEDYLLRSVAIREEVLPPNHPNLAESYNNLAELHRVQGRYENAEDYYEKAVAIFEEVLPLNHPNLATSYSNLAAFYQAQEEISFALEFKTRASQIEESNLESVLATGSEANKRNYINTLQARTYGSISLHLQSSPNNLEAAKLALTTILQRKGRILEATANNLQLLRNNLTPENQQLFDTLQLLRTQLANLTFQKTESIENPQEYRAEIAKLETEAEEKERQLFRNSAQYRQKTQPVSIAAVQKLIPDDAALVEIMVYQPIDVKALKGGKPRYAAYIIKSSGAPQWADLGETEAIDELVVGKKSGSAEEEARFTQLITNDNLDAASYRAKALHNKIIAPIQDKLGNINHILLSPDSQLNLIPFAALQDETGEYLLEKYQITYLTSGRDLLRWQETLPSKNPAVVMANPSYDEELVAVNPTDGKQGSRSGDFESTFTALPNTKPEGEEIASFLGVQPVMEAKATENAIKKVQSPVILHLATHGFFLPDQKRELLDTQDFLNTQQVEVGVENPLLRSGLVFAGVNQRKSGDEDGVLTALEVTGVNLLGTKLVVLSACDTGVGDIATGEGVYGLRRAFVMAGAESQVMSLWKVDDKATKDLMIKYYGRLKAGEGRSEALREVQLEMLRNGEPAYHWAAFIPSGNWTPMEGWE